MSSPSIRRNRNHFDSNTTPRLSAVSRIFVQPRRIASCCSSTKIVFNRSCAALSCSILNLLTASSDLFLLPFLSLFAASLSSPAPVVPGSSCSFLRALFSLPHSVRPRPLALRFFSCESFFLLKFSCLFSFCFLSLAARCSSWARFCSSSLR